MRVTNNIYVLSGSYYSAVNHSPALGDVYGIRTTHGMILIDCGVEASGPALIRENLAYYGIDAPITHLIITHAHHDHCGGAREIQDTGAKVIVGREDSVYCTNGGVQGLYTPFDNSHIFPEFTPDMIIDDDSALTIDGLSFDFIKIPGHTPGSMAVRVNIDGRTALFTGDSLQPDGTLLNSVTFGWQGDPSFDRKALVNSIMKLMKYETDMILPGHGKICLKNGTDLLRHAAQTAFLTLR